MPTNQIVYFGIDNYVTLTSSEPEGSYVVGCANCDTIYKTSVPNTYIVRPEKGKFIELQTKSAEKPELVYSTHHIRTSYLPDPVLFFGATKNGGKASKMQRRLFAVYPPEMNIEATFKVISWDLYVGEEHFSGDGDALSDEASSYLITRKPDDGFAIRAVIVGSDGIQRVLGGAFKL